MEHNAVLMIMPLLASVGFFALVAWIVFVFVDGKRRREQLKATSEFNAKILEKMGSTAEFGAFLETEGGKRFMKSLTAEGPSAKTHIVRCTERGILCLAVGIGLLLVGWMFPQVREGFIILGVIVAACGIGNLVSCLASYALSKNLGIIKSDDAAARQ
jgi:hypothetical protein